MMQDAWSLSVWLPALVVLGVGVLTAGLMTWRLRASAAAQKKASKDAGEDVRDLQLEIQDLTARRDELYSRLRGELEEVELSDAERRTLESSAARVLRDLDQAQERLAALGGKAAPHAKGTKGAKATATDATATAESSSPAPVSRGPSPVAAFGFGVGLTALVAVLFFWATQDAKEGPRMGPQPRGLERSPEVSGGGGMGGGGTSGEMPADHPPVEGRIPPELEAQIEAMQARLAADAGDIAARKELALLQVQAGLLMEGFENAKVLLAADPDDPDGLYVHSVVRLAMGQNEESIELIDRILAMYPDHLLAMMVRGAALLRMGDREGAIASWEQALEITGGSHPDIEFLIEQARAGVGLGAVPEQRQESPPPARAQTAPPASPASPPPASSPTAGDASTVYTVEIDLAPGASGSGALFVSIRSGDSGPPVAVKRIDNPRFPITLTLGPDDSMMGQPLPASGVVRAKLDADGSVATDGPEDLRGEARGNVGGRVVIALGR